MITKREERSLKARKKFGRNREIIGMFTSGATNLQVMAKFNLGPTQVKRLKKSLIVEQGTGERKPGSGRKRKTMKRDDRRIVKIARGASSPSAADIQTEMLQAGVGVCERTIRRRLHESGNRRCVCTAKPWVSEKNRIKRLKFAKDLLTWSDEKLRSVIYSDESKFVFRFRGQTFTWRRPDEKHSPRCMRATVKGAQKSVMVWGCFGANGMSELHRVRGRINQADYKQILIHKLLPIANRIGGNNYIFQQDNAPIHTAGTIKSYLRNKNVTVMEWPPQSPDLNPIENLWFILDNNLKKRNPANEDELFRMLNDAWKKISSDTIDNLMNSMRNRCRLVIENRGMPIPY